MTTHYGFWRCDADGLHVTRSKYKESENTLSIGIFPPIHTDYVPSVVANELGWHDIDKDEYYYEVHTDNHLEGMLERMLRAFATSHVNDNQFGVPDNYKEQWKVDENFHAWYHGEADYDG